MKRNSLRGSRLIEKKNFQIVFGKKDGRLISKVNRMVRLHLPCLLDKVGSSIEEEDIN